MWLEETEYPAPDDQPGLVDASGRKLATVLVEGDAPVSRDPGEWLTIAARSDYEPVFDRIREVLTEVGRMKYLRPLYSALGLHPRTRALARDIYAQGKAHYHSLSCRVIESVMEKYSIDRANA